MHGYVHQVIPGIAHDASHRKDFKDVTRQSSQARSKIPMINLFDSAIYIYIYIIIIYY